MTSTSTLSRAKLPEVSNTSASSVRVPTSPVRFSIVATYIPLSASYIASTISSLSRVPSPSASKRAKTPPTPTSSAAAMYTVKSRPLEISSPSACGLPPGASYSSLLGGVTSGSEP